MRKFLLITSLTLASWAPSALAVDGVIEINQTCVASGCFASDDPGFPITIGTIGSYRLTSSLFNANVDINTIEINATGVTLDLNGFRVAGFNICSSDTNGGPVTCLNSGSGIGIDINADGAAVENGHIGSIGDDCISSTGFFNARISNLTIDQCGSDGIESFSGSRIDNVTIRNSSSFGISAGFSATLVTNSFINGNGDAGQSGGVCSNNIYFFNNGNTVCLPLSPNNCSATSSC